MICELNIIFQKHNENWEEVQSGGLLQVHPQTKPKHLEFPQNGIKGYWDDTLYAAFALTESCV